MKDSDGGEYALPSTEDTADNMKSKKRLVVDIVPIDINKKRKTVDDNVTCDHIDLELILKHGPYHNIIDCANCVELDVDMAHNINMN